MHDEIVVVVMWEIAVFYVVVVVVNADAVVVVVATAFDAAAGVTTEVAVQTQKHAASKKPWQKEQLLAAHWHPQTYVVVG